jgi:hypothetical protein
MVVQVTGVGVMAYWSDGSGCMLGVGLTLNGEDIMPVLINPTRRDATITTAIIMTTIKSVFLCILGQATDICVSCTLVF